MNVKTISTQALKNKQAQKDIILLDVREPHEVSQGYIPLSYFTPLGQLSEESLPANPPHLPLVIYCRSGKRSADACLLLQEKNKNLDVCSLEGGIIAWKEGGGEVVKP